MGRRIFSDFLEVFMYFNSSLLSMPNMCPKSYLAKRNTENSAYGEISAPLIVFTAEIAKIAEHFFMFFSLILQIV